MTDTFEVPKAECNRIGKENSYSYYYRQRGCCLNMLRGGLLLDKAKSMRPKRHFLLCEQDAMSFERTSCPVSKHLKRPFPNSVKFGNPSKLFPSFFPVVAILLFTICQLQPKNSLIGINSLLRCRDFSFGLKKVVKVT